MIPTDEQWRLLQPHFPPHPTVGRPPADDRLALEAILWRQINSSPWRGLPAAYPAFQVCHRRAQRWRKLGLLWIVYQELERDLHLRGALDLRTCFHDGALALRRLQHGTVAVVPAASLQGEWQFVTAMLYIAPGLTALNASCCKSADTAMPLEEFQGHLVDYLDRLLAFIHESDTPHAIGHH